MYMMPRLDDETKHSQFLYDYTNKTSCFWTDLKNLSLDRRPESEGTSTYAVLSRFETNPGLFTISVCFLR